MSSKKHQIAVMIDLDWAYRHHQDVYAGVQKYARSVGDWDVIIDPHADSTLPARGKRSPYAGVIARATRLLEQKAKRLRVPVVNVWFNSPAKSLPSVFPDFAASAHLALEHLQVRGLRRLAYLGFARDKSIRLQCDAFCQEAKSRACKFSSLMVHRTYTKSAKHWAAFRADLSRWMDGWELPCGVLASGDLMARYLVNACLRRGWRVPEDVAVIGTDDEALICLHPAPSLSSIDLGYVQVGMRASQLLQQMMDGSDVPPERVLVPPRGLFPRRSTDMVAVDDPIVAEALQFMSRNLQKSLNVDDIADAVSANRRTLERRFREAMKCSVNEELNRLRLERAKRHLMESDVAIKAIAAQCGFGSVTQMGLVFRRYEDISPSEYRQQHAPKKVN